MDCPSPECREELKKEVADKFVEERGCMVTGFSERLKTKTLLTIAAMFVIVSIAAGGWIYAGYSNAQDRQNDRLTKHTNYRELNQKQIHELKTGVELIKKDIKAIKDQTYRNESIQIEMLRILSKLENESNDS